VSDLSPEARELLRCARAEAFPSPAERVRSAAALKALVAAPPTATAATALSSSATGTGLVAKAKALIGVGAVVVAAGGTAAMHAAWTSSPTAPPSEALREARSSRPAAGAPPRFFASSEPVDSESVALSKDPSLQGVRPFLTKRVAALPAASRAVPEASDDLDLLSRARQALASHQAQIALALLDEHSTRFPRSEYGEERSYTRVRAFCELGRTPEARLEAEGFLRAWPSSMYAAGVRRSCGFVATPLAR
jgi:hypothetical protein